MLLLHGLMAGSLVILAIVDLHYIKKLRLSLGVLFSFCIQGKFLWNFPEIYSFYLLFCLPILIPSIYLYELMSTKHSSTSATQNDWFNPKWILVMPLFLALVVLKYWPIMNVCAYLFIQSILLFSILSKIQGRGWLYLLDVLYIISIGLFDLLFAYSSYKLFGVDTDYHSKVNYYAVRLTLYTWITWYLVPVLINSTVYSIFKNRSW